MPRPTKGPRLGGGPAHERLLLANLAAQLFTHKSITTTEAKAKRMRPLAERLVTFAKRGDLHARRRVLSTIGDKTVVHELFTQIAPLVADRPGGYTRIVKTGFRKGDNAPMAVIELVLEPVTARRPAARTRGAAATAAAPAAAADAEATATPTAAAPATEGEVAVEEATATEATPTAEATTTDEPTATEATPPAEATATEATATEATATEATATEATAEPAAAEAAPDAAAEQSPAAEAEAAQSNVPGTVEAPVSTDEVPPVGPDGTERPAS